MTTKGLRGRRPLRTPQRSTLLGTFRPVARVAKCAEERSLPCNNERVGPLLVLQLLMAAPSPGVQRSVWLLERPGWQRQESALLEALRIYTSDLKVAITLKVDDAKGNEPAAQLRAAQDQCSSRISMVAWFAGDVKEPMLQVLHCATLFVDQLAYPRRSSIESYAQTLALKIRALLALEPDLKMEAETSVPDEKDEENHGPSMLKAVPELGNSGGTLGAALDDVSAETLASRSSSHSSAATPAQAGMEIGLSYLLATTADWEGLRQGVSLRLGLVLPRYRLAIELDSSLSTPVVRDANGTRVSLAEIPLGLSVSFRWQRGKWMVSCGSRFSLHIAEAEATSSDGRRGAGSENSIGLGASEQIRYDVWGQVGVSVSLTNEIMLPRRTFTVVGKEVAGSGLFQGGVMVGAVYRFF